MSGNPKQRLTLTDLKEPQQMRELNRQLSWIWDQLLGGLNMKSLDAGTRQVIEDKAGRSELTQTADEIRAEVADEVSGLQSQIDQTPEKIELAVKEVQVGGANYLLGSGTPVSNAKYNIANYKFSDDFNPQAGETYTVRIWGSIASDRTSLGVYNTNGYIRLGAVSDNGDGTYSLTFKWRNDATGHPEYNVESPRQIQLYQAPRDATGVSTITRIKLEAGNKATDWTQHPEEFRAGTNVVINKDEFSVSTGDFNVNITSEDGEENMLHIDKDGVSAQSIECPNVMERYDGPTTLYVNPNATQDEREKGNYFLSLNDAADKLNRKFLPNGVTINLTGTVVQSKKITFYGISSGDWVTLKGTSSAHAKIIGQLNLYYNSAPFKVQYVDIDTISSGLVGVEAAGRMQHAEISNCIITGRGDVTGAYGVNSINGAMAKVSNCELYDLRRSVRSADGGLLAASNCKGNCSPGTNLANMHLSGTQACSDASTWTEHPIGGEIYKSGVTINQGSKPTPEPEATSVSYSATNSDVYAGGGWNNYSNSDIYQGYTDALGEHRGCFWFDNSTIRSALKNKTIKQATLKLYQVSGAGRNQPVQVNLEGITATSGTGNSPAGNPEYGVIGTTLGVGKATTFTIPTAVITNLVAGTINGLMLRTGESASMKGDDNSYHYARFAGHDSGNRPVLTVTYA